MCYKTRLLKSEVKFTSTPVVKFIIFVIQFIILVIIIIFRC